MSDTTELDWPEDRELENGNYQNICYNCDSVFIGYKRRTECKKCFINSIQSRLKAAEARVRELESILYLDPLYGVVKSSKNQEKGDEKN